MKSSEAHPSKPTRRQFLTMLTAAGTNFALAACNILPLKHRVETPTPPTAKEPSLPMDQWLPLLPFRNNSVANKFNAQPHEIKNILQQSTSWLTHGLEARVSFDTPNDGQGNIRTITTTFPDSIAYEIGDTEINITAYQNQRPNAPKTLTITGRTLLPGANYHPAWRIEVIDQTDSLFIDTRYTLLNPNEQTRWDRQGGLTNEMGNIEIPTEQILFGTEIGLTLGVSSREKTHRDIQNLHQASGKHTLDKDVIDNQALPRLFPQYA